MKTVIIAHVCTFCLNVFSFTFLQTFIYLFIFCTDQHVDLTDSMSGVKNHYVSVSKCLIAWLIYIALVKLGLTFLFCVRYI
jgi:hypothetical protein